MNSNLLKLFKVFEADKQMLLEEASNVTAENLTYRPTVGQWTILEILSHLLASEIVSLHYMKKKSLGVESLDNSGMREALKMALLKISQRIPLKYKAPKIVIEQTKIFSLLDLKHQWNLLIKELKDFLEAIEDKNIRKKIYKHPVAGRFDVMQALSFMHEHQIHHLPQIRKLARSTKRKS